MVEAGFGVISDKRRDDRFGSLVSGNLQKLHATFIQVMDDTPGIDKKIRYR